MYLNGIFQCQPPFELGLDVYCVTSYTTIEGSENEYQYLTCLHSSYQVPSIVQQITLQNKISVFATYMYVNNCILIIHYSKIISLTRSISSAIFICSGMCDCQMALRRRWSGCRNSIAIMILRCMASSRS